MIEFLDKKYKDQVTLKEITDTSPNDGIIWIGHNTPIELILTQLSNKNTGFCIQKNAHDPKKFLNLAASMLCESDLYFTNPTETILNPLRQKELFTETILDRNFSQLSEKYSLLSEIEEVLSFRSFSSTLITDVLTIADEFLTNAIFHSTQLIEQRTTSISEGKNGNIKLALSKSELVISCSDPHGTLLPQKHFSRIRECCTSDLGKVINFNAGGAGIGAFMVCKLSSSYIVAVKNGTHSVVSSTLPLGISHKSRSKLGKNILSLYLEDF